MYKKIPSAAMLAALAIIFGYIESLFPPFAAVPGIKLGISNIVVLFALYRLDKTSAVFIMLIKVIVSSLLFSGINVMIYSLGGGILSVLAMSIGKKAGFGIIGVSMLGGIFHNMGQLAAAAIMLGSTAVFYHMPVLIVSGIILGSVTGYVCKTVIARIGSVRH